MRFKHLLWHVHICTDTEIIYTHASEESINFGFGVLSLTQVCAYNDT